MLVATAGHVDHGKTTLVRALTGTDCDRLEEEKRRGITIVLGYAEWTLPSGRTVSLIDVPGHERLVRTMLSGAGGLDAVLAVISGVSGVMPQTREHLNACALLGVTEAVVAMTFSDKLDDQDAAVESIRSGLRDTPFPDAQIIPVSAISGQGVAELGAAVEAHLSSVRVAVRAALAPCLPIDRSFSVDGFGTVVTGSLLRGSLSVGQTLSLTPGDRTARVRGLQVHGQSMESVEAGHRVAVNLTCSKEEIPSGAILTTADALHVGRVFDAEVHWLNHARMPLKRRRGLSFHIASTSALADVHANGEIQPGARGTARIRLDRSICLPPGFRFVLRGGLDIENGAVVGGGRILDPHPPKRRSKTARETLLSQDLDALIGQLVSEAKRRGVSTSELARRLPIPRPKINAHRFDPEWIRREVETLVERTAAYHQGRPMEAGIPQGQLAADPISQVALERAVERKLLIADAGRVASPSHRSELDPALERMARKVMRAVGRSGLRAYTVDQLVERFPAGAAAVHGALKHLKRGNRIVVTGGFCFPSRELEAVRQRVASEVLRGTELSVGWLKDETGLSRKHAIPLWTWLDGCGTTVRRGDRRVVGPRAKEYADE